MSLIRTGETKEGTSRRTDHMVVIAATLVLYSSHYRKESTNALYDYCVLLHVIYTVLYKRIYVLYFLLRIRIIGNGI